MKNTFHFKLSNVTVDCPELKGVNIGELEVNCDVDIAPEEYKAVCVLAGEIISKIKTQ
jgi:hypothetical protein